MKPLLMAVWAVLPCESDHYTELNSRTTTVYACPNTFRELAGPFVAEGWTPPPVVKPPVAVSKPKPKKTAYRYKKKKKKRPS